jgi:hypothetical protein
MSDTTPSEPQGTPETPADTVEAPAQDATDWKAEARKWEARAKENSGAARRLSELEESQKSEIQKAQERAEAAERELATTKQEALRLSVAAKHGVPAHLLAGSTEDEIEASAQALIEFRGEQATPGPHRVVIPAEGGTPALALNDADGLESALRNALGIPSQG